MEFNKAYNRQKFVQFLQHSFLPNTWPVSLSPKTKREIARRH